MSEKDLFKLTFKTTYCTIVEVCERQYLDETKRMVYTKHKKACLMKQELFNP